MRADRLLRLALLLQARGRMTASALAAELEVTVRTIYRDLEALGAAGIPVYAESGPGGGCQLVEGYRTPLTGLTNEEAAALLILGVPTALRDVGLGPPLQAAHRRLNDATRGPRTEVTVHLDMPRWFHATEETTHLPQLADGIRRRHRVAVTHSRDGQATKSRELQPLGIVNKAGAWYLVSSAGERVIVLRVARIRTVRVLDTTFRRPKSFDLVAFWGAWSTDFETSRPHIDVVVYASPDALATMPEVFGDAARQALRDASEPDASGWRHITLRFEHDAAAISRLAGFGSEVEIKSPPRHRAHIVDTATAILSRYN
jgi:predicted DNA-binding transcriptional regulator YafY